MKRWRIPGIALCLLAAALLPAGAGARPKYGPKAVPLFLDQRHVREATAGDFWRLAPFYVPQANPYACSVASIAMVLNAAIQARQGVPDTERSVTQNMLLDTVRHPPVRALVSAEGHAGRHGLTLGELGAAVGEAFCAHGVRSHVTVHSFQDRSIEDLRVLLEANERDPMDFILAHFVQDDLTGAEGGPYAHISPVGAYDAKTRRVLILDVDRDWYSPYWVGDEDLLAAIRRATGPYGPGGLVRVCFSGVDGEGSRGR